MYNLLVYRKLLILDVSTNLYISKRVFHFLIEVVVESLKSCNLPMFTQLNYDVDILAKTSQKKPVAKCVRFFH